MPSHYGEAVFGLRVIARSSLDAVDLPIERRLRSGRSLRQLEAWVPAHHALFVEGGALTGSSLVREPAQVFLPLAGLRYVYTYGVSSQTRDLEKRRLVQVYAQLLAPPLNPPEGRQALPNGRSAGAAGFGGRVGLASSAMGRCLESLLFGARCPDTNVALGYAPYPRVLLLDAQLGYHFY